MPKANELKKGDIVDIDGVPHLVKTIDVRNPSSRSGTTLYKVRFTNLKTGLKLDESLKGDDLLKASDCIKVAVQFSYVDGDEYVFMDTTDYTQYPLRADVLDDQVGYLTDGLDGIWLMVHDGQPISAQLPHSVQLEIIETAPAIKGSSATSRTKTAKLSTGIEVQVPEYLATGDRVQVTTESGEFMRRV